MFREKSRHFQVGQKKSSMHSNLLADFFSHFQVSMEHRKKHCLVAKIGLLCKNLFSHIFMVSCYQSYHTDVYFLWTCLSHLIKVKKKGNWGQRACEFRHVHGRLKWKKKSKTKNNQASKNLGYCSYLLNGNCPKNKHPKWKHHWKF